MVKATLARILPKPVQFAIKRAVQLRFLRSRSLHVSQAGQDLWVFGESFNERPSGYFVDVGAHDGVEMSNTYLLERRYGWSGVCVEANPDSFEQLRKNRTAVCVNACLDATEMEVQFVKRGVISGIVSPAAAERIGKWFDVIQTSTTTLTAVLRQADAPRQIDYLSIDVEGAEDRILGSFDFSEYRILCMTVERPSAALRRTLDEHEYVLVREIPALDSFYVHRSFVDEYRANLIAFYKKQFLTIRWL